MRLTRERTDAALTALFWVPLALAALWIVVWPPLTVDGPAHLLGATAIADHGSEPYATYYELDWFPTPNLAGTALLAALVKVGSLRFAETAMLLVAALATPLALRWAIRGVRPESTWLAVVALPLSFGYLYFYGFWNYCIGIALALVCVGLTLRAAPTWRRGPTLALAAVMTLTWLTHLVPFVAAAIFLAAVVVTCPRVRRAWAASAAVLAPGVALSLAYLLHTDSGESPTWTGPLGRLVGLISLHTTVTTFSHWEDLLAAGLAVVLAALGVRAVRGGLRWNSAAVAVVATTVLLLVTPTRFGIDFGLIDERLAVFPVLFGLLWLAAAPPSPRAAVAATTAFAVATVVLAAVRLPELRRYDRLADEYAHAADAIEAGSVVLALRFHTYGPDAGRNAGWDPTRHLASELAADTGSIDVGHYEAVLDYFPATFRQPDLRRAIDPELNLLAAVPALVGLPGLRSGCPDPITPFEGTLASGLSASADPSPDYLASHRIRYVLLVGGRDAEGESRRAWTRMRGNLECEYEQVGLTGPHGLVEIWRLR